MSFFYFYSWVSGHLFELLFICLLFFRRSSAYDFEAYFAIAFGVFIGTMVPTLTHPTIRMFVGMLYQFSAWFFIVRFIYLIISVKQLYHPNSQYGAVVFKLIENPISLFVFTIFLNLSTHIIFISPGISINYSWVLIEYTVIWIFIGCITKICREIIPEIFMRYIFGGIGVALGLILVVTSVAALFGIPIPFLFL